MNYAEVLLKILEKIKKDNDLESYADFESVYREGLTDEDFENKAELTPIALSFIGLCEKAIKDNDFDDDTDSLFYCYEDVLTLVAPYDFDSYLTCMELDREPSKRFYQPRRQVLRPLVKDLQDLADDKLDLLAISMPPGTGKTTLAIFFLTWMAGRCPAEPMLTASHSNNFIRGVYDECLRLMLPGGEYLWDKIFPNTGVSSTNAKDCRIDVGERKRFETLEFTSIGTGNAGLYRASQLLYCDDLVSGIEVALSKERLAKLWETYTTDLSQRKIGDHCKELHIATRWSVHDIIGRLELQYGDSDRAKFVVMPAVNEKDESNFDYKYGVGFNTDFYHKQRELMDDASWKALYMNEPIEREGLVYNADELRRYFELPEGDPDCILAVCDTKDRGKDYAVMPIAYCYGQDAYIEDVVCDNSMPDIVDARLEEILLRHKVQMCRFESNSAGGRIAQKIQEGVKEKGGITRITTKYTTAQKETKIIVNSAYVKEHFLFKDDSLIRKGTDYFRFIDMLCSYTIMGKNRHDDAPDAISMLSEYIQGMGQATVEVFRRPF